MIAFIRGRVAAIEDEGLVIETGGVGLLVGVPMTRLDPRPEIGGELMLHTYLQVKEDGWQLYGFSDREQLAVFKMLLSISGIGAKTALAIIDRLSAANIAGAVASGDTAPLTSVSGVGKKTAERIILELKDKFAGLGIKAGVPAPQPKEQALNADLLSALKQLGYTATESRAFAMKAQEALGSGADEESLLREALRIAMRS